MAEPPTTVDPGRMPAGGDPPPVPLDALTLPLAGSRLIEASAGTGKTWTIAALYLRLVLGHGGAAPLACSQILVMTFTRAATRELSDRIRQRLVQAAAVFRSGEPPADDGFLQGLLAAHAAGAERDAAAWRLACAAEAMDDAAVVTIDAWCQRMLREHAFDSGSLFDEELQADESALRAQAARDYWRRQVLPLAGPALDAALALWGDADGLARDIGPWLEVAAPDLPAPDEPALAQVLADHAARLAGLKDGWVQRAQAMHDWLDAQLTRKASPFRKSSLNARRVAGWLQALRGWAADPWAETPDFSERAAQLLRPEGLRGQLEPGVDLALPGHFDAFARLMDQLAERPRPAAALRAHAARHLARSIAHLKAEARRFGFADIQARLDDALDPARHGARAERLRERILAQYPAAMVDEFQDTSPVQLAIFDRLYRIDRTPAALSLLLIGDPKQAIYGFRGADIHSYLRARRATAGRHHALGTNHRSTAALVQAVNTLFSAAEARPGDSAFLYHTQREGDASCPGANPLPFMPVQARGRPERLLDSAGPVPALHWVLDEQARGADEARQHLAALAAGQVQRWLADPAAGFAQPGQPPVAFQRLRPADIAVLVRSGTEAQAVQLALARRHIASVYLSDRDSVFASAEAADLLRLLKAMAAPREQRMVRAALATGLLDSPLPELRALADDDDAFDRRSALLPAWQAVWQSRGVLAALRQALHELGLPARWLAQPGGERRLTNVLHLAELLQAESARLDGEQALLRWLARRIGEARDGAVGHSEDTVLRLESDADRVQVVTVHKSKGLEYPVVLLPFAGMAPGGGAARGSAPLRLAADDGLPRLLWQPDAAAREAAAHEAMRESLRLLYVALTRARHALWVGVPLQREGRSDQLAWPRSALGRLVSGQATARPTTAAEVAAHLHALVERSPGMQLSRLHDEGVQVIRHASAEPVGLVAPPAPPGLPGATAVAAPLAPARPYQAEFDRHWSVASYSQLVKAAARSPSSAGDEAAPPLAWRRDDEPGDSDTAAGAADAPWHRFPRGATPGNLLHGLLEWLAGEGFALESSPALQQALRRRCEQQGWGHRADDLLAWLLRVCHTPLPPLGCALAGVDRVLPEMEFWLPSDGLAAANVDALCRRHLLPGRDRPALPERLLHGMLMGFADAVVAHEDRYAVIDYKSNALGPGDSHYSLAAMQDAVLAHRYDVQAALYLLALHRLMQRRLGPAWRPAQQLQGAVFLFLRGIGGPLAGACPLVAPLALLEALDAMLQPLPIVQALAGGPR